MDFHDCEFSALLETLEIIKIVAEKEGKETAQKLFPIHPLDSIFETYLAAFDGIDGFVWSEYYEDDGVNIYKFVRKEMTEYFRLAHEYGDIAGISRGDNPYIKAAFECLNNTVGNIPSWCYRYRLYDSKTRYSRLYFLHDDEYWMPVNTICALYNFFDFFSAKLPVLMAELKKLERVKPRKIKKEIKQRRLKAA
jgi:hypothetical protein